MKRVEVVVVGAGPAGSACALTLARGGVETLLIDHRRFPRTKTCGEYLNVAAVAELDALGMTAALRSDALPLRGMRLFAHGESAQFAFTKPAWSLSRIVLDAALRNAAIAAGAEPMHARFRSFRRSETQIELRVRDAEGHLWTLATHCHRDVPT